LNKHVLNLCLITVLLKNA